jgi:hypothetical protein
MLRPATPPPDFDLDQALESLRRFGEHHPVGIALAHYGLVPVPPEELLGEAAETLQAWAAEAERAWRAGEDIAEALAGRFAYDVGHLDAVTQEKLETLNGFHSNAAGLRRWLEHRHPGHRHPGESPAGESPAGESPAGESPAGESPAGESPAGEAHAG